MDEAQQYSVAAAESYKSVSGIGNGELVERGINDWLHDVLRETLPGTGIVLDAGCGSGRLFPNLRGHGRTLLGVDSSRAMLENISGNKEILECTDSFALACLLERLQTRQEVHALASLETFLPQLGSARHVDAAVSSFNAVCFPHPRCATNPIATCLKTGGSLYFTSNAFIPSDQITYGDIDLFDSSLHGAYPHAQMFRHVLHTTQGDVPLQDHVHHMGMLCEAFDPRCWTMQQCKIFPGEGCTHLSQTDTRYADAYAAHAPATLLEPSDGFTYVKLGVHATRK